MQGLVEPKVGWMLSRCWVCSLIGLTKSMNVTTEMSHSRAKGVNLYVWKPL
jgi:hypothetical protein